MKFHCDRCKTRYSISDERVRGKILKIRCKNCAAVVTVREPDGDVAAEARAGSKTPLPPLPAAEAGAQSALSGAFRDAGESREGESPASAPASLESQWYLAEEGEQEGPFDLDGAKSWVRSRPAGSELYCWSEGYDDWLLVDKISHFRNLRKGGAVPEAQGDWDEHTVIDPGAGELDDGPKPLFAATMQKMGPAPDESSLPPPVAASPRAAKSPKPAFSDPKPPEPDAEGANLDFDIGEASRVVSLPLLMSAPKAQEPSGQPTGGESAPLPGIENRPLGRGTGENSAMEVPEHLQVTAGGVERPRPEILKPKVEKATWIPLTAAAVTLVGVAVALVFALTGGEDEPEHIARGGVSGTGLGYNFESPQRRTRDSQESAESPPRPAGRSKKNIAKRNTGGPSSRAKGRTQGNSKGGARSGDAFGEVDLSGGSEPEALGPLDGDDLMRVYRKNQIAVKMCYERALKQDPLLRVPKTWVSIKVSPAGQVTSVSIPSLAGTPLGNCLRARIRRWRFRKATEVFTSKFPVVFDS